ncbi:CRISPR-associated helicase cas3 [Streptomyces laurentii]|uniref:CRISPR-associated helicase cas3 n=1 Tax=Streptomyces laurentii TaxID=39478 RepID=A0A161JG75_STRLU|nr:CRISPR-associated helicase cas3 [Streptomyces laurentii]
MQAGCVIADPGPSEELAVAVDEGDVVVVAGPVDPAERLHACLSRPSVRCVYPLVKASAEARDSPMEGLWARHPIGRS